MKPSKYNGSRSIAIKINLAFLLFAFIASVILVLLQRGFLLQKNDSDSLGCSSRSCKLKITEEKRNAKNEVKEKEKKIALENAPEFLIGLDEKTRIGLVKLEEDEIRASGIKGKLTVLNFDMISETNITWKDLFPNWIDEECEVGPQPTCPTFPMPNLSTFDEVDLVIAQLPCQRPKEGWNRDVFRLQVHLIAANLAAKKGRRNGRGEVKVVLTSRCEPMRDIFRCDDLVKKEGTWWLYEINAVRLEEKVRSPPGTCELVLPLRDEGKNKGFDVTKLKPLLYNHPQTEAYVTVLHSSDAYVCGAIALAYSIRKVGSTRDLILLHDEFISPAQLHALQAAGWSLRKIERIHNPNPRPDGLFEYNYSKFRIFQLTDYDKLVFIDSDIVVLRNLDILFSFPSISARVDHDELFNSGIMVVEPSNCTFKNIMLNINSVESYNGGDQGFLNEIFVWWHRLPRRTNFFKVTWENTMKEKLMLDTMFVADPAQLYTIHYFGLKPWMCYRDYDCNWDLDNVREYANDEAHWRWWRIYDEIDESLKPMCKLSTEQKNKLERWRSEAEQKGYNDAHWKRSILDPRRDE
ncbi:hypothetical protein LUZ60_005683 [Juncus effusus]|nr:hypothetical protein LUZ60_005683 [Juncus effusus]